MLIKNKSFLARILVDVKCYRRTSVPKDKWIFCVVFSLNIRYPNKIGARERISLNYILEFRREVWKYMKYSRRVYFRRFLLLSEPLY
jgi:hypothetical protein